MISTGREIASSVKRGLIEIEPFSYDRLNPNSYNLRLDKTLLKPYGPLDMAKPTESEQIEIPETGYMLEPGQLYLGCTIERTYTSHYVPMLEGRSSIGRLGLFIHVTAGLGDVGFNGRWTLELSCIMPIRIYAGVEICQIYYHTTYGEMSYYETGKYQGALEAQSSRMYKEFKE